MNTVTLMLIIGIAIEIAVAIGVTLWARWKRQALSNPPNR